MSSPADDICHWLPPSGAETPAQSLSAKHRFRPESLRRSFVAKGEETAPPAGAKPQAGGNSAREEVLGAGDVEAGVVTVGNIGVDGITIPDVTGQQFLGQLVADFLLDQAAQRAGTEVRVVATFG